MDIVVLAGGLSPERNVSLSSGALVTASLRQSGHRAALIDLFWGVKGDPTTLFDAPIPEEYQKVSPVAPDLDALMQQRGGRGEIGDGVIALCAKADIVYLALHGGCGENGSVQAMLDLLGVAYTGSGSLPSAIAMDKDLTKKLVCHVVNTPQWSTEDISQENIVSLSEKTALPVVVKPFNSGSSLGVSIAHTKDDLLKALKTCLQFGSRVILEQYISGREIQVAILGDRALPSIEIIPREGFYDYKNKYQPDAAIEICPAEIPPQWEARLAKDALAVFTQLNLGVYARADFIVTEDGTPYFLEINTLPGMTPTSLVPQEAAAVGISYHELCNTIINLSLALRKDGK